MPDYLKQREEKMEMKETPKEFNHQEHMMKVQRVASQIIELAQQLKGEEEYEEEAEKEGSLFDKVIKKV